MRRVNRIRLTLVASLAIVSAACTGSSSASDPAPLTDADRARASEVAVASSEVRSLLGTHEVRVAQVTPAGVFGFAQVSLALVDGTVTITGTWPRVVVENPAKCETCQPDGPLRTHTDFIRATYSVDHLLVDVDRSNWTVRQILPVPLPFAPPVASGAATGGRAVPHSTTTTG